MSRGLRFVQVAGAAAPCAWPPLFQLARALSCCPSHAAHRWRLVATALPHRWRLSRAIIAAYYGGASYLCAPSRHSRDFASVLPPLAAAGSAFRLLGRPHASCRPLRASGSSIDQYNIAVELGRPLQLQRASIDRITVAATHSHSSQHGALPAALVGKRSSPKATASANAADGLDELGSISLRDRLQDKSRHVHQRAPVQRYGRCFENGRLHRRRL